VDDATIENHSGKQIIAALLTYGFANTTHAHFRFFTHEADQMPDGGSERVNTFSKLQLKLNATNGLGAVLTGKVAAVIFADGELRGEDSLGFQANVEYRLQCMRQAWQMAKAGNWTGLKAKANDEHGEMFGKAVAERILDARTASGDSKAIDSFAWVGNFPASTWKGGLLNKLKIAPAIQAIGDWFMPTAYAQSGPPPIPATPAGQR
jgi:hypothetical protein